MSDHGVVNLGIPRNSSNRVSEAVANNLRNLATNAIEGRLVANQFETIDDYIASFPPDVQVILTSVLQAIRRAAPGTDESISYQIPTFKLNGKSLVYFAGWKHHIGLYPVPRLDDDLDQEVSRYRAAKDTLRFPFTEPVPYDLVERLVAFMVKKRQGELSP